MARRRTAGILGLVAMISSSCVFTTPLEYTFSPSNEVFADSSFSYDETWTIADDGGHRVRATRATSEFFDGESASVTERVVVETIAGDSLAIFIGRQPSITDDGSTVVFSRHPGFGFDDGRPPIDIIVADVASGALTVVSLGIDGAEADGDSGSPVISGDGSTIAFVSEATNLVAPSTSGVQVFAYDVATATTRLVSVPDDGTTSAGDARLGGLVRISDDGSVVAFTSRADDLVAGDDNDTTDVFRVTAGTPIERVVSAVSGASPNGQTLLHDLSGDGQVTAIGSTATNITIQDLPGDDLFLVDADGGLERVEMPAGEPLTRPFVHDLSDDGSLAIFSAFDRNLSVGPGSEQQWGFSHAYVYDRESGETTAVSGPDQPDYEGSARPSMTGDGRLVLVSDYELLFAPNNFKVEVTHHLQATQHLRIDSVEPAVLEAGTTTRVTVSGAGFTEELAGLLLPLGDFDLDAVSIVDITDRTSITADITIPAGATPGPVRFGVSSFATTALGPTFLSADECECITIAPAGG